MVKELIVNGSVHAAVEARCMIDGAVAISSSTAGKPQKASGTVNQALRGDSLSLNKLTCRKSKDTAVKVGARGHRAHV